MDVESDNNAVITSSARRVRSCWQSIGAAVREIRQRADRFAPDHDALQRTLAVFELAADGKATRNFFAQNSPPTRACQLAFIQCKQNC